MAKGDSTGIAQQGAQLDPNRFNRFGNPNMGRPGVPNPQGVAGPPPGVIEMLMQMLMGNQNQGAIGKAVGGAGKIQQGINRLKGNNKPEMNKNQPKMPTPQSRMQPPVPQMMQGGGQFILPQPRIQDMAGGMGGGGLIDRGMPQMAPPMQQNMGMGPQMPQDPSMLMALMQGGGGRRFV